MISMIHNHQSTSSFSATIIIILLHLASIASRGVTKAATVTISTRTSSSFAFVAPCAAHPLAPFFRHLSNENNPSFELSKHPFPNSDSKSSSSSSTMSSTKNNPESKKQLSPSDILDSPSAERNKAPIWDMVLKPIVLPIIQQSKSSNDDQTEKITVLELAAGSGVHTHHFVYSLLQENENAKLEWHPSDPDPAARISIDARVRFSNLEEHILPANGWILGARGGTACGDGNRDTDGKTSFSSGAGSVDMKTVEGIGQYPNYFDLILCINMIHIAPWEATLGLMECARKVLKKGGILVCYGPFKVGGTAVVSNLKFDESLRSRNPSWGVRNLEEVVAVAEKEGLEMVKTVDMPANNLCVLFRKA